MAQDEMPTCPFCGLNDESDYQILLHVEIYHSESGESPFAVKDAIAASQATLEETATQPTQNPTSSESSFSQYVQCPYKCGEQVPAAELQFHTDFHVAENMAFEDAGVNEVELTTGPCNDANALVDISNNFDSSISDSIRNHGQLRQKAPSSTDRKRAMNLKGLFFGSPSPKKQQSPVKKSASRSGKVRRLGVR